MRTVIDEAQADTTAIGEVGSVAGCKMARLFNERLEETGATCRPSCDARQIH